MLCNNIFLNNFASFPLTDNAQSSLKLQDLVQFPLPLKKERHICKTLSTLKLLVWFLDHSFMVGHHKGYCLLFYYILITNLKNENSLNLKKMYYTSKCILFQSNQIRKLTRISGMLHSLKHFQSFFLGTDFRSSSTSHTRNSVSYFIVATPI